MLLGIPAAPGVAALGVFALLIGSTHDHAGLVVVHQVQGKVERMGADVDEGAAALLVLVEEHAPVGGAAATDGQCLGVVYIAQLAAVDNLL